MEKIDLSTNSKKIQDLYNKVVRGDVSTTYGVFSVDKNGVLDATTSGSGDLDEFVSEFSDGQVQFGLTRVTLPGSDVVKNLLLGWCPDNAPAKLRLSFAANFADVSRVLSGYHVQITARDSDDLDVDEFLSRVGAAAGARYGTANAGPTAKKAAPKPLPTVTSKPSKPASFIPKTTGKPIAPITPKPAELPGFKIPEPASQDSDEWGGEKEIEERDFEKQPLESVPSAYKPTKVDIAELRKQKSDTISSKAVPSPVQESKPDVSDLTKHQTLGDRMKTYQLAGDDGRLTSLPKPKVSHSVSSRYTAATPSGPTFGAKPNFGPSVGKKDKLVGGLSRNFGAENGKTPAQLWAEKRGQYKDVQSDEKPVQASSATESESSDFASKLKSLHVSKDVEDVQESENAEKEEDVEKELEKTDFKPTIIKPEFQPPPRRNVPTAVSVPAKEEEEETSEETPSEEMEDVAPAPAPAPSLPSRNLPLLPSREEPKVQEPTAPTLPDEDNKASTSAVAQYDYEKDEDNEVEFNEGDIIVDIEFVDEEWWSGKNSRTGEIGLFPGSYVTIQENSQNDEGISDVVVAVTSTEPNAETATAIAEYEYEKEEDNEISFAEGDLIVEIDFVDEDWWSGKHSKTGEVGLFPANYVKLQ